MGGGLRCCAADSETSMCVEGKNGDKRDRWPRWVGLWDCGIVWGGAWADSQQND